MDSIGHAKIGSNSLRFRQFVPVLLEILLAGISLTYFSLPLLGNWLVHEDAIHEADAIVVLAGNSPERALEAARLYRRGYAREIWLTHPKKAGSLDEFGQLRQPAEDSRNSDILCGARVPRQAIRVLDLPIVNTADELNAIDSRLKESGGSSVIIVTNKAHTGRVNSLWRRYHSGRGEIVVHAVPHDQFAAFNWWKTPSSRAQGVHELLGMMNIWAGMPVHRPLQTSESAGTASLVPLS